MLRGNPILAREIRTGLRGRRAFVARTAFVAILALVVIATWGTALLNVSGGVKGATVDMRAIPGLGRQLFTSFGLALLVLLLAVVPGYAAGVISGERERQTLESTLCTQLKPRHIITGKLGACIMLSLALILSSLPAMGAVFLLGGVSPLEVALVFAILFATAVFVSALSLYVSALCRKTYAAIMISYGVILGLHFGLAPATKCVSSAFISMLPSEDARDPTLRRLAAGEAAKTVSLADPYWAMASIFRGAGAAFPRPEGPAPTAAMPPPAPASSLDWFGDEVAPNEPVDSLPPPAGDASAGAATGLIRLLGGPDRAAFAMRHLVTVAALLALTLLLLIAASRRVGRIEAVARRGPIERLLRWLVARQERWREARRPAPRAAPTRARSRAWNWLVNRISNPIFARDLRGRMLGRFGLLTKSAYVGLIGVAVASVVTPALMIFPEDTVRAMVLCVAVIPVLAGVLAATSIAVEKEQQTFQMILATPMKPRAIIFGKLAGAFYHAQPLILLALPIALFAVYVGTLTWRSAAWMLALTELFGLAACAIGVLASLLAHRAQRAVSSTLLFVGLALVGPFIGRKLGFMRILLTRPESRGEMWLGAGPLAAAHDVFLRPEAMMKAGEWAAGIAAGIAVLAFVLALILFRRAARKLIENG